MSTAYHPQMDGQTERINQFEGRRKEKFKATGKFVERIKKIQEEVKAALGKVQEEIKKLSQMATY